MDSACQLKTSGGSRLFVIIVVVEICLLSAGVQCLEWHLKPPRITSAESGKNVTISWGYTLENNENLGTLTIIYMYPNKVEKRIAVLENKRKRISEKFKKTARIIFGNSTVSIVIFTVRKKRSPQKYCAKLDFTLKTDEHALTPIKKNCTELFVYERPRITFHTPNIIIPDGSMVELRCNASGDPNPSIVWSKITTEKTFPSLPNSSMPKFELTVDRETLGNYCCVATNNYGNDTACTNVSIGDGPLLLNTTPTYYKVTKRSITIACRATGNPIPKIEWTNSSTSNIIHQSEDGNYIIPFKKCSNETLIFYCRASSIMGNTTRKKIIVDVNTPCNKTNSKPRENLRLNPSKVDITVVIVSICIIVVIVVGAAIFIYKIRKQRKRPDLEDAHSCENKSQNQPEQTSQMKEESPYGEPIDTIKSPLKASSYLVPDVPSRGHEIRKQQAQKRQITEENPYGEPLDALISPLKTNASSEYASPEEVGITGKKGKNACDGDNTYAHVMNSRSPKKPKFRIGKNKRVKDPPQGPLIPLYEELPAQKNAIP